jgi:predicted dehydrogenase
MCEKPLARDLAEAQSLVDLARQSDVLLAVAYNYSGYPAVREAHERVRQGFLGEIRRVLVEYQQDWLMRPIERTGNKQAGWRTDPTFAGDGGCVADIGSHAFHLAEYVSGTRVQALCADLTRFVPQRAVADDANILLRFEGGGKGILSCSQIACGEYNDLNLRIYGADAAVEWHQQRPDTLTYKPAEQPWQQLPMGTAVISAANRLATRLPAGHPEGYLEAFAVLYRHFIADLRRVARGESPQGGYPTALDGLRGMRFIARALESSYLGGVWLPL